MAFPDKLLRGDETVLWHRHPHWRRMLAPALLFPLLTLVAGIGVGLIERHTAQEWQFTLYGIVGGAWLVLVWWRCVVPWLAWRRTHFVLTDQRILFCEGVLSRRGVGIELLDVSDVACRRSVSDRMTGAGTLVVRSASGPPLVCRGIAQATALHELIEDEVDALYEDHFYE